MPVHERLRTLWLTAGAIVKALVNLATPRREPRVTLASGDLAPDFSLPGSDGRTYRLSDYRSRAPVVLAWFPKAFTPGCTKECRSLQEHATSIAAQGAAYFGISTDDPATNRQFAASLDIGYPILSDEDGLVGRAFGVVGATGFAARWTFYIGADGRIAAIDKDVHVGSHGADIASRLAELDDASPLA